VCVCVCACVCACYECLYNWYIKYNCRTCYSYLLLILKHVVSLGSCKINWLTMCRRDVCQSVDSWGCVCGLTSESNIFVAILGSASYLSHCIMRMNQAVYNYEYLQVQSAIKNSSSPIHNLTEGCVIPHVG